jgi:hypothetical protein
MNQETVEYPQPVAISDTDLSEVFNNVAAFFNLCLSSHCFGFSL